ncbi:MAG TPA: CopD family protein [Bacteroidia bacterium]|nr:CopD family protein [Bacteroidia bacterium]
MVYVKALHLIFMVSWFAALFYMPRLLIYHVEAQKKDTYERGILSDQFKIMQKRLWMFIGWPAMTLTWIFGLWTSWYMAKDYLEAWFILKLIFVFALSLYHLQTHMVFKKQQNDNFPWTSFRLRLWNEVATVLLFIIIFLVVLKQNSGWVYGTLGVIMFGVALFAAVLIYKRNREKTEDGKGSDTQPPPPPPPAV